MVFVGLALLFHYLALLYKKDKLEERKDQAKFNILFAVIYFAIMKFVLLYEF
jgi:hypothetical protein